MNINKDFLENIEYLNGLIEEAKGKQISELDKKQIYEIVCADMYLKNLIVNTYSLKLVEEVVGLCDTLDTIVKQLPIDEVKDARGSVDYIDMSKVRYSSTDKEDCDEKKIYSIACQKEVMLNAIVSNFIIISICVGIIVMIPFIHDEVEYLCIPYSDIIWSEQQVSMTMIRLGEVIRVIEYAVKIVLTGYICVNSLEMICDILYIGFYSMRLRMIENGFEDIFIHSMTRSKITEVDGTYIEYKKVKSSDRVKRNIYWLDCMLCILQDKDSDTTLYVELANIKNELSKIRKESKYWYCCIVKVEYLHDKYLKEVGKEQLSTM